MSEFRLDDCESLNVGDEIKASIFVAGDKVDVSGISKGKALPVYETRSTQRSPMTHRFKIKESFSSMGMCSNLDEFQRVRYFPGHMGVQKLQSRDLEVVKIDAEQNLILVKVQFRNKGRTYLQSETA